MSARVLEIEGQFLYIPGCMIISFDDSRTHTTEVKIVRTSQAIDLGKLREVHEIYKETLHDMIGVEEAMERLETVLIREQRYNRWILVGVYGLASACVGPFAFQARAIDLPIAFFLGCCLGFMQLILAPKSELYSNIFEVTAAVLTSFLARAFGSIRGGELFCFSALAQSSIALILPGYTVRTLFMNIPLAAPQQTDWRQCAVHWSCSLEISSQAPFAWCTPSSIPFSSATALRSERPFTVESTPRPFPRPAAGLPLRIGFRSSSSHPLRCV